MADAYYRGLWMLLPFTMQMTLILVLSAVVSQTSLFRAVVVGLADRPNSLAQVVALAVGVGAALMMATPGHFLEARVGLMPLTTTIWSGLALVLTVAFPIGVMLLTLILMPRSTRPLSAFHDASAVAAEPEPVVAASRCELEPEGFAAWVERSPVITAMLGLALCIWLYHHFVPKGLGLDLNAMNTILLTSAFVLHRNIAAFSKAIQVAVPVCWPILVLYHLYGGVAGLLQFTTVGERFALIFANLSTPFTFPMLTAIGSSIVAVFVPSSGGQWVVQGFVTATTAEAVGSTAQRGLLAVAIGDHMGNFLSPFWPVLIAGIARVDFRIFFGYGVIFALLWFTLGVGVFTFVP